MSFNSGNLIRSLNDPKRNIAKSHNLSPNVRPIYNPAKPIKNNLFPKNHIIYNNNNYNIKVNVINRKKEKIIEGDLNFNEASKPQKLSNVHKTTFLNNKAKNGRGMPRKSPLPIPRTFKPKGMLNFNRIFTAKQRPTTNQYNRPNNIFKPQGNAIKNNNMFGGKIGTNTSKTFNSLNIKNDRSHSPILRSGQNKLMNLGIKPNKNRYISKSPILGKTSAFNRAGGIYNVSLLNNGNNMKKLPKKPASQVNNNIHKKAKANNINPSQKRNTVISGEIYQDSSKINKINYSINNAQNNNSINVNIKPIFVGNNNNNNSSNAIKHNEEDELKNKNINKSNISDEKTVSKNNEEKKKEKEKEKENNNMINKVNDSKNKENNSELSNNIVNKDDEHIEERKNNNIDKSKELKNKNNKRSQSQGPIDPLRKKLKKKKLIRIKTKHLKKLSR